MLDRNPNKLALSSVISSDSSLSGEISVSMSFITLTFSSTISRSVLNFDSCVTVALMGPEFDLCGTGPCEIYNEQENTSPQFT